MKLATMKLLIAGGRDFNDYLMLRRKVDLILNGAVPEAIISGMADGADKLGIDYAGERGIPVLPYPADWENLDVTPCVIRYRHGVPYNAVAGNIRNKQMGDECTHAIIFHDGKSRGTQDMINILKKLNKPFRVVKYV